MDGVIAIGLSLIFIGIVIAAQARRMPQVRPIVADELPSIKDETKAIPIVKPPTK